MFNERHLKMRLSFELDAILKWDYRLTKVIRSIEIIEKNETGSLVTFWTSSYFTRYFLPHKTKFCFLAAQIGMNTFSFNSIAVQDLRIHENIHVFTDIEFLMTKCLRLPFCFRLLDIYINMIFRDNLLPLRKV